MSFRVEVKVEPILEHLDYDDEEDVAESSMLERKPSNSELKESKHAVFIETIVPDPPTFDGNWSDDDKKDNKDFFSTTAHDVAGPSKPKRIQKRNPPQKPAAIVGEVIECKYCDTQFSLRRELIAHMCKLLKCNLKNFICRFCKKEISKKNFSEHMKDVKAHPMGFVKTLEEDDEDEAPKKVPKKKGTKKIFECGENVK